MKTIRTFQDMQDEIIKLYGFEDENTIDFCKKCESAIKSDFNPFKMWEVTERFNFLINNI